MQEERPRRFEQTSEKPKVDENKLAFQKIAEELRQKEKQAEEKTAFSADSPKRSEGYKPSEPAGATVVQPVAQSPVIQNEKPKNNPVDSLVQNHTNKKVPSKENISSLKSALADVISKTKVEEKSEVKVQSKPVETQVQKPVPEAKKENPAISSIPPKRSEQPLEASSGRMTGHRTSEPSGTKEVPEDVLRKLLDVPDNK
jgi:hypothetical protein